MGNVMKRAIEAREKLTFTLFFLMIFSLPLIGYAPINIEGGLKISNILAVLIFLSIFIDHCIFRKGVIYYNNLPTKLLMGWICVSLISSIIMSLFIKKPFVTPYFAEYPVLKSLKTFVKTVLVLFVFLNTASLVRNREILKKALRFLVYGGIFASLYGIYQIAAFRFGWPLTDIFNNNISFGGDKLVGGATVFGRVGYMIRIGATAVEPGIFANFLMVIIPLYAISIINNVTLLKTKMRDIMALGLMLLAFILTYSRAGWLSLAFVAFLIAIYVVRTFRLSFIVKKIIPIFLIIAILITAILASTLDIDIFLDIIKYKFGFIKYIMSKDLSFNKGLSGNRYPAYDGRVTNLATGIRIFKRFPLFGIGWGNYGFYYYDFVPEWGNDLLTNEKYKCQLWASCRSLYLSTLVETGVAGGALFFAFLISVFGCARRVAEGKDAYLGTIAAGLAFSLIGILFHGITLAPFQRYSYFYFLLALIVAVRRISMLEMAHGIK